MHITSMIKNKNKNKNQNKNKKSNLLNLWMKFNQQALEVKLLRIFRKLKLNENFFFSCIWQHEIFLPHLML